MILEDEEDLDWDDEGDYYFDDQDRNVEPFLTFSGAAYCWSRDAEVDRLVREVEYELERNAHDQRKIR